MKSINRNAKKIQSKSRQHQVEQVAPAGFTVTSGSSGEQYRVILNGVASCSCKWGEYRKIGTPCGCSHVLAVMSYLSEQAGYTVMAWASEEEAKKQHRKQLGEIEGLHLTARR